MNKITIIGNLTKDPETHTTQSGVSVCSFTVAVNRKKVSDPQTDFFRVNAWRQLGDVCAKYLSKGRKVAVVGELQARMYETNNGKQMSLDINADEVEFLSAKDTETATVSNGRVKSDDSMQGFTDISSDDLPF